MSENVRKDFEDCWYGRGIYQPGWAEKSMEKFLEHNIVIPRDELPSVKRNFTDSKSYSTDGENIVFTCVENARAWVMRDIAVWQFMEAEAKQEAEKNAARDKRRDELAAEFTAVNSYNGQLPYTQNLINRIIDLEAASNV